jgi:enediyne biosynthesis thioesterase
MAAYEMRHVVAFEETNLLGNVYYVNFISWQGRCRELFLRDHAPLMLQEIRNGLVLVTTRCSCEYLKELKPFDEVLVRMHFGGATHNRLTMKFDYFLAAERGSQPVALSEQVARGEQQVAFMRREDLRMVPTPIPDELLRAARAYEEAS